MLKDPETVILRASEEPLIFSFSPEMGLALRAESLFGNSPTSIDYLTTICGGSDRINHLNG